MKVLKISVMILLVGLLSFENIFAELAGKAAPEIKVSQWLGKSVTLPKDLKGKTIILEFWATWCGPCRKMIPEINELVNQYQSDDVIFISITKEAPKVVEEFLKKNTMKAYIAIDDNGKTNENYKIKYIPQMYIINKAGNVEWEGHPSTITSPLLGNYLKTGKIDIPQAAEEVNPEDNLLYALTISKTNYPKEQPAYSNIKGGAQFINLSFRSIMQMLLETSEMRVEIDKNLANDNLDIYYQSGTGLDYALFKGKFINELANAMNIKIDSSKNKVKVLKLSCSDCSKKINDYNTLLKTAKRVESKTSEENGITQAYSVPMTYVVRVLENKYKKIIVDNTKLQGYYDFYIDLNSFEMTKSNLKEQGILLEESEEEVMFYYIKKK